MRRSLFLVPALMLLLTAPAPSPAQERAAPTTVWVDEKNEELGRLLGDAAKAEKEGDWRKAASLYDEAADRAKSQVFRVTARTCLGIREYVKSRIHGWPAEGLAVYRKITDPRAKRTLEQGLRHGRSDRLRFVARHWPMSSYGPKAMLALGTRALKRGDAETSLRHFLEILRLYPEGEIPHVRRADLIARAALAAAKRGDRLLLEEMRARAARLPGDTTVTLAGGTKKLADVLDGMAPVRAGSRAAPGWVTPGGSSRRDGGRGGPGPEPLTLYWAYEIPLSEAEDEDEREASPALPVHPLIVDGEVIVPGHLVVRSLALPGPDFAPTKESLAALLPHVNWAFPGDPEADPGQNSSVGQLPAFATVDPATGLLALPFRDPAETNPWYEPGEETAKDTLLTLSLASQGKLLDQRGGSDPAFEETFRNMAFHGAPAFVGTRLYCAASQVDARVQTLVTAFDVSGGPGRLRPLWQTSVCAGGGEAVASYEPGVGPSSVSTRNGIVYVCSNSGAVAALDGESGEILWIHTYEQAERRPGLDARAIRARQPWRTNPPILDHRFLYVAPLDADRLFVYFQMPDLATGFVTHARFGRDEVVNGFDPEYVLGVRDGVVFLAGSTRTLGERPLFAVKTGPRFFGSAERKGDERRILWRAEIEESSPRGRGVVAGDAIYFPTRKGIYRVDAADGQMVKLVGPGDPGIARLAKDRNVFGNLAVSGR
ncbi:MAG: hypothetical protein ABFS86_18135, partial [Planctomycetota bacterium]